VGETWTIRRVLRWTAEDFEARGLDSARLDAELLVAHALDLERVSLYLDMDRPLSAAELADIRALVKRRRMREPVAYILGHRDFYGRTFEVSPAVLVPRPDTETLVERALGRLGEAPVERVLDLCTGSGIIAVTLAAECPELQVDGTDASEEALEVARRNAERHGVADRVRWMQGDLFDAVPEGQRYGLVTANPPYVAEADLDRLAPEITEWEPRLALAAGPDGLDVLRRMAAGLGRVLTPGGTVLVELGQGQAGAVSAAFESHGVTPVGVHRDLGGIERVIEARLTAR
jgi:release factor glutamine methyltransferase